MMTYRPPPRSPLYPPLGRSPSSVLIHIFLLISGWILGCSSERNVSLRSVADGGYDNFSSSENFGGYQNMAGTSAGASVSSGDQPGEDEVCIIDLVFAVDNSGSMQEEIRDFRDNVWPQFAQALTNVSGGTASEPFRVAVVDACPNPATFHTSGSSGACNFQSGQPWMVSNTPNLTAEFQCVGDILDTDRQCTGDNDDEQPASSAASAIEMNPGFLRDDALLIVIAITDEDEQPVPTATASDIYNKFNSFKTDPRQLVFLGIGGESECQGQYGSAERADMLIEITNMFSNQQRGVFWNLCQGSLEEGLSKAMSVIGTACDELSDLI